MAPVVGVDVYRGSDIVRGPAEIDPPGGRANLVAGRADEDVRPYRSHVKDRRRRGRPAGRRSGRDNGRVRRGALHAPGGSPKGSVNVSAVSLKADPVEGVFASDRRWRMQYASTHPPDIAFDGLSGREGPSEGDRTPPSDGHDCF